MQSLTAKQKRFLRARAHNMKPVVTLGNAGLTTAVMDEIASSIEHHELMKIKLGALDKDAKTALLQQICDQTKSQVVYLIGHVATIYRAAQKPQIQLPKD
ncbi:MAG: ribosome assembly RNA-binding protein YhbY [Gammaproteobacteria bacterium]|nr:ribosome assembly RNA-binding protein YhbY [Gammaproteobacteria bacterium]MDH5800463.1 ribosome assembly RNA-binding protein YhbY [Gammaproteobacteria bacterium]